MRLRPLRFFFVSQANEYSVLYLDFLLTYSATLDRLIKFGTSLVFNSSKHACKEDCMLFKWALTHGQDKVRRTPNFALLLELEVLSEGYAFHKVRYFIQCPDSSLLQCRIWEHSNISFLLLQLDHIIWVRRCYFWKVKWQVVLPPVLVIEFNVFKTSVI